MAQYEHLPIYKKAYDLTLYFEQIVRNFSRYHKYTVGTELRQHSREALRLTRTASSVRWATRRGRCVGVAHAR